MQRGAFACFACSGERRRRRESFGRAKLISSASFHSTPHIPSFCNSFKSSLSPSSPVQLSCAVEGGVGRTHAAFATVSKFTIFFPVVCNLCESAGNRPSRDRSRIASSEASASSSESGLSATRAVEVGGAVVSPLLVKRFLPHSLGLLLSRNHAAAVQCFRAACWMTMTFRCSASALALLTDCQICRNSEPSGAFSPSRIQRWKVVSPIEARAQAFLIVLAASRASQRRSIFSVSSRRLFLPSFAFPMPLTAFWREPDAFAGCSLRALWARVGIDGVSMARSRYAATATNKSQASFEGCEPARTYPQYPECFELEATPQMVNSVCWETIGGGRFLDRRDTHSGPQKPIQSQNTPKSHLQPP